MEQWIDHRDTRENPKIKLPDLPQVEINQKISRQISEVFVQVLQRFAVPAIESTK